MIQYKGGDGSSKEQAVIIIAPNEKSGIDAEYKHLESVYGQRNIEWRLNKQTLIVEENKYFDLLIIELRNTELLTFWFNINSFYGKEYIKRIVAFPDFI